MTNGRWDLFFFPGRLMPGLLLMIYGRCFKGKEQKKNVMRSEKSIKNVIVLIPMAVVAI